MLELLRSQGPKLSSELIKILIKKHEISESAARKKLSRLEPPITKIKGLFSDNQAFYHLQEQFKTPLFYQALFDAFKDFGKKYYSIIKAINFHYGFIKKDQLPSFSFSPVQNLKGHKNFDTLVKELLKLQVLIEQEHCYILHSEFLLKENFTHFRALEIAKKFVVNQFNDWARNTGQISYNKTKFHSQFGKFSWGLVAPSYICSLAKYSPSKITPGFVIADILIGNKVDLESISFFIQKIEILKQLKNLPNFLPFLIVDDIELEALNLLRQKGVIIGFTDQLFGCEYKELLKALINTITNAGAILKRHPDQYFTLINKLEKLTVGKTNNLRGDLFELAVGYYHSYFCQSLDVGKLINHEGKQREIDVLAIYPKHVVIAECKGYTSPVPKDVLDDWLTNKVSVIRKWFLDQPFFSNKTLIFEFWSSGDFTPDALNFISNLNPKNYRLTFIGRKELMQKSKEIPSKKFKEILMQYYINEI